MVNQIRNRCYAIKDNKIWGIIDCAPFSVEKMNKLCEKEGFDGWFELDEKGALALMQVDL